MLTNTSYITSQDGTRIAYDITGTGPAIALLHGGSGSRQLHWHELGYVNRLKDDFTVITIDARGHGESDKPTCMDAYGIQAICQDILDVADRCQVDSFAIWGYSYGGNMGRFLAVDSERVTSLIVMGIPMGPAASERFQKRIKRYRERWGEILMAQQNGTLDLASLSEGECAHLATGNAAVQSAWIGAIPGWGGVEPEALPCPTLWLVGSENETAMESVEAYESRLAETNVDVAIIDGLDHLGEIAKIEQVLPTMLDFTKKSSLK